MKAPFALLLVALSVSAAAQTPDKPYPSACGPDNGWFDVKHVNDQSPPTPEQGKALVYFVQYAFSGGEMITTSSRIGMDGAWLGAVRNRSYIAFSIAPGEHHLCVDWQTHMNRQVRELAHFTAEAGNTYYFRIRYIYGEGGSMGIDFTPAYPDQAKFIIASNPVSVAKPRQ
jgi:hypothetical protein